MHPSSRHTVVKIVLGIFRTATANMQWPQSHQFLFKLPKVLSNFPNSGVFLFTLRKPTLRSAAWMCFLFRPRDKTESVITWRASALNQTLHFFGIESSSDEGEWRARGMGDTNQTRELASFTKEGEMHLDAWSVTILAVPVISRSGMSRVRPLGHPLLHVAHHK